MKLIKFSTILFVLCTALMVGCGSMDHIPIADDSWKHTTVSHDIPVVGDEFKLNEETSKKLAIEIDRFPSAHKNLIIVYVSNRLREEVVGLYKNHTIYVIRDTMSYMKKVLWHELSHAMVSSMADEHLYEWCEVLAKRLENIGLEYSAGSGWSQLRNYNGFPTRYSTKNVHEFIAEHVMEYTASPKRHASLFPWEHALIIKHKLNPVR